ncbi:MAG: haloalkane dehalogenase [Glaciecola sp.]
MRQFPFFVPTSSDNRESSNNEHAWTIIRSLSNPVLTVFGELDPITIDADKVIQRNMKGGQGHSHVVLENGAHFIREDALQQLVQDSAAFFRANR